MNTLVNTLSALVIVEAFVIILICIKMYYMRKRIEHLHYLVERLESNSNDVIENHHDEEGDSEGN